jgi:predicted DNA-binding transcriptional regulator AlpA
MRVIPRNKLAEAKGIPFSDEWLRQLVEAGKFPKPIKVGNRVAFLEDEIDQWLRERAAERDAELLKD